MLKSESKDYKQRSYLSAIEAAKYLNISVRALHGLVQKHDIKVSIATSGQMRFDLGELKRHEHTVKLKPKKKKTDAIFSDSVEINGTTQKIFIKNSMGMNELSDDSIHLMITSPPYFNAKMYSRKPINGDLGDVHDVDEWFEKISAVWQEVYRVLEPGRKAFINIMNLPIRLDGGSFRH